MSFLEELAKLYADAARLQEVWQALVDAVDNKADAERVLDLPTRRVARRICSLIGDDFTEADGFNAGSVLGVLKGIVGLRNDMGLASPVIPTPRLTEEQQWWRQTEEGPASTRYRFLDAVTENANGMHTMKMFLLDGDWGFQLADDGSLIKAKRK
jgi:hypothetical protein